MLQYSQDYRLVAFRIWRRTPSKFCTTRARRFVPALATGGNDNRRKSDSEKHKVSPHEKRKRRRILGMSIGERGTLAAFSRESSL